MLPLAGSNPAIPGYNQWLDEVSTLHHKMQCQNKKLVSRWLSTKWEYWFALNLSPVEAIEKARAWYEKQKLIDAFRKAYGYGPELPDELKP